MGVQARVPVGGAVLKKAFLPLLAGFALGIYTIVALGADRPAAAIELERTRSELHQVRLQAAATANELYALQQERAEQEELLLRPVPVDLRPHVVEAARAYDIPLPVLVALGMVESRWDCSLVGAAGEIGCIQVLPSTAVQVAHNLGMPRFDLRNPVDNLAIGAAFLRWCIDHEDGDLARGLACYNGGDGAFDSKPKDTRAYAAKVLSLALQLTAR